MTIKEAENFYEYDKKEYNLTTKVIIKNWISDIIKKEKIRKEILELTSLKLLYSKNTIPEYGYERAKRFINKMNKKLNSNLSINRIDEITSKDYKVVKKLIK